MVLNTFFYDLFMDGKMTYDFMVLNTLFYDFFYVFLMGK